MNVLKYHKDNFYTWHTDHGFKTPRTMSVILFCNDEYEGGEIFFKLPNQNDFIIQGEVGDLVLFPSNFMYAHCVKPVTKGERITVVGWIV
jgi:predicted 2-oxoglutarate/Fe(II)-dependent dioxygenase YbiX